MVPALVRDDPAAQRPADQEQVADQVQHLVPGAFVGEAELIVDRPVGADDQQIFRRTDACPCRGPQLAGFVFKDKRPGRGDLR